MQSFDLNRVSSTKISAIINRDYGGRFTREESWSMKGIGIGGFSLYQQDGQHRIRLRGNFELLKNGLALYLRNIDDNLLRIWSWDEIDSITISKPEDVLVKKRYSIFQQMLKWGINFHYARIFLLENEIRQEHKTNITINLNDYEPITLEVTRFNPMPIIEVLQKASNLLVYSDVKLFRYNNSDL